MLKNVIIVVLAAALGFGYYQFVYTKAPGTDIIPTPTTSTKPATDIVCAQVITPARNPDTGDITEFPTPCDVPDGWELIRNDIPDLELNLE